MSIQPVIQNESLHIWERAISLASIAHKLVFCIYPVKQSIIVMNLLGRWEALA